MNKPRERKLKSVNTLVADDKCPKCGGELDTGWECNDCGFDAMPIAIKGKDGP